MHLCNATLLTRGCCNFCAFCSVAQAAQNALKLPKREAKISQHTGFYEKCPTTAGCHSYFISDTPVSHRTDRLTIRSLSSLYTPDSHRSCAFRPPQCYKESPPLSPPQFRVNNAASSFLTENRPHCIKTNELAPRVADRLPSPYMNNQYIWRVM